MDLGLRLNMVLQHCMVYRLVLRLHNVVELVLGLGCLLDKVLEYS